MPIRERATRNRELGMIEISVAAAILIHDDGRILIAQRAEPEHLRGLWEFPGGKIEDGESPEQALVREIREELEMEIGRPKFLGEFPFQTKTMLIRILAFTAKALRPDFKVLEHLDVRWVEPSDLDSFPISPADLPIISAFRALKI